MVDLEEQYRALGPMVIRRCASLLGNEDEAIDATQEVFMKLLQEGDSLAMERPHAYLYCVATRVCLNRIRSRDRRQKAMQNMRLEAIAHLDTHAITTARSMLARLFGEHPETTRVIAVLHYLDGMTLSQTAQVVGMSVSGVRARLRKLRAHLKELDSEGGRHE